MADSHTCDVCKRAFHSRRGLSLHKRSRHPNVRNAELLEPEPGQRLSVTRRPSIWNAEKLAIVYELEERYRDDPHINIKIAASLLFKTNKQFSNQRSERRKKAILTEAASDSGPTEPVLVLPLGSVMGNDGSRVGDVSPLPDFSDSAPPNFNLYLGAICPSVLSKSSPSQVEEGSFNSGAVTPEESCSPPLQVSKTKEDDRLLGDDSEFTTGGTSPLHTSMVQSTPFY